MKLNAFSVIGWLLLVGTTASLHADPISTAFAYQGRLQGSGNPSSGLFDFHFTLYGSETNSDAVAETAVITNVVVAGGRFTVLLDFGPGAFGGEARWLEIGVRTNGDETFTILSPRQPMLAVPYALHAANAGLLNGATNSNSVSTIISSTTIISDQNLTNGLTAGTNGGFVVGPEGSVSSSGTFAGDGAGLTNLQGVASLTATNLFSGVNIFSNKFTVLYPANTNEVGGGNFIDFHRPLKVTSQYIRWFDDDSTELGIGETGKPFIAIGTDVAFPEATFWCLYDNVLAKDVLTLGNVTSNRGHFAFNNLPAYNRTFTFSDLFGPPGSPGEWAATNVNYTMEITSRSNGLVWAGFSHCADGLTVYRASQAGGAYVTFATGDRSSDWRIGGDTNLNYDLVFRNTMGDASAQASSPGPEILRLHAGAPSCVYTPYAFEVGTSLFHRGMNMPEMPWENGTPGGLGGPAGWVGIKFTVGSDDMAIHKLGRWTKYGLTNSSHQIILLTQSGDTMITNTNVRLPKSAAKKDAWVWGDCYTVIPAGSVVWIVTDAYPGSDYYAVLFNWPYYTGADTNIVGSISGVYTNNVLDPSILMGPAAPNYNLGPVSYQRY